MKLPPKNEIFKKASVDKAEPLDDMTLFHQEMKAVQTYRAKTNPP